MSRTIDTSVSAATRLRWDLRRRASRRHSDSHDLAKGYAGSFNAAAASHAENSASDGFPSVMTRDQFIYGYRALLGLV